MFWVSLAANVWTRNIGVWFVLICGGLLFFVVVLASPFFFFSLVSNLHLAFFGCQLSNTCVCCKSSLSLESEYMQDSSSVGLKSL